MEATGRATGIDRESAPISATMTAAENPADRVIGLERSRVISDNVYRANLSRIGA